jgi:hypothetical protein
MTAHEWAEREIQWYCDERDTARLKSARHPGLSVGTVGLFGLVLLAIALIPASGAIYSVPWTPELQARWTAYRAQPLWWQYRHSWSGFASANPDDTCRPGCTCVHGVPICGAGPKK